MEIVIHKDQPYEDIVRGITENERQDPDFTESQQRVDALFQELGARVVHGISYAGEQREPELSIPAEQSEAMRAFSERPA